MINLPQGFKIDAAEAIDSRLTLSKAEMLAIKDDTMPDIYLAVCKDNNSIYIYSKDNSIDSETGRFRAYATSGSEIIHMEAMTEDEILAIIDSTSGGITVTPSDHFLKNLTAEDIHTIISIS